MTEDAPIAACADAYRFVTGLLVRPDGVVAWATDATGRNGAVAGL